jgi:hypothetical protein
VLCRWPFSLFTDNVGRTRGRVNADYSGTNQPNANSLRHNCN